MCKKTPLYDKHVSYEGKIVPFAGYYLPVQYKTGVMKEHLAVRNNVGLFDVSHMGEVHFKGKGALNTLNHLLTNDMANMALGQVRYSPMCNQNGGIVDDLVVVRCAENDYLMIVNAANRLKDVAHIKQNLLDDTEMADLSENIAQLALQGKNALPLLETLCNKEELPTKYYHATLKMQVAGILCLVSKTGYTGELGYEIYCANCDAEKLFQSIVDAGKAFDLTLCGLGARDTLRLEAGMPLYGHEMTDDITPFEAGLSRFVKMDKQDFIGKSALVGKETPERVRVGLRVVDRGIVREMCALEDENGNEIGMTTSGTHCPYLETPLAMALVNQKYSPLGTEFYALVRNKKIKVQVTELPFYKRQK